MTTEPISGGWDYTFEPVNGGHQARMTGWGLDLGPGDYLLLSNPASSNGCSIYRIVEINYYFDPSNMWRAEVRWCPPDAIEPDVLQAANDLVTAGNSDK